MSSKWKDTDYLFISTRLRALESKMLTRERMERMLEARSNEDAVKVLAECGYDGLEPLTSASLEQSLKKSREETFAELAELSPNGRIVDVFRMKYDYHNAKALVKCAATGEDPSRLLMDAGRVAPDLFRDAIRKGELGELSEALQAAIPQAQDVLSSTGDPQRSDFVLDRAYYQELTETAQASGSDFLQEYVRLLIDSANLRSAVRSIRMKKNLEFLGDVLVEGGDIDRSQISGAVTSGSKLEPVFAGPLQEAAALGDTAALGGSQTAFEKACDDAVNKLLQRSRMIPFGDGVLVSYAAARENDITAARIILSGRLSGVPTTSIRERLREAYV